MSDAYDDVSRAIRDAREAGGPWGGRPVSADPSKMWPPWLHLVMAVATVIVTVTLAYAALDKRISLIEQKLDYVVQQVRKP
jgi:hypothetical protein